MKPEMIKIDHGPCLKRIYPFAIVLFSCLLASVLLWQRSQHAYGQARASLGVRSSSFSDGGMIPRRYTCDGANLSPHLAWQFGPHGTRSFVLEMDDPDAPIDFTHWLVYNIPPGVRELAEGTSTQGAMPQGSAEGKNNFGQFGYGGPCPPRGNPHHYVFRVYALDRLLDLPPGATRRQLDAAMDRHILSQGQIIGLYQRMGQ
jgi:Raf kinase inhibitor-like YbhB/YbcL family protein